VSHKKHHHREQHEAAPHAGSPLRALRRAARWIFGAVAITFVLWLFLWLRHT